MEMGFDEKEVVDALRVNNNQQNAAVSTCSWDMACESSVTPSNIYLLFRDSVCAAILDGKEGSLLPQWGIW